MINFFRTLTYACLVSALLATSAQADQMSDKIFAQEVMPDVIMSCTERSTKKSGLCVLFNKETGNYLAFVTEDGIQWVKHYSKDDVFIAKYRLGQAI